MGYTIILDSSNTDLSIGLAKEGVLIDYISYSAWQQQSEFMVKELDTLLTKYEVKNEEIDDLVVSIGPGSYTGVRIALTIAKTIGYALNIPVYPISALQILKRGNSPSVCLINARSNRSYVAVYQGSNVIVSDTIWSNEDVKKYIEEHKDYTICGDTKYLGIEGYKSNVLIEALSVKQSLVKAPDALLIKPVYLKD